MSKDLTFPHLPARPWRYIGMERRTYQAIPGDPNCPIQPGASCDHCGTGIYEVHTFEAVQTKERFVVGSTCVYKMAAQSRSRSLTAAELAIKEAKNSKSRARRDARLERLRAHAQELVTGNRDRLASMPHPTAWCADKGETAADWADDMLRLCGLPGLQRFVPELCRLLGVS